VIRVQGISKEYRSGRGQVQAITDVSFTIENNNTVAVFGKSGSGKTTLLNCLGGLEQPERGKITCFGVEIHSLSEKALCLFQRRNIGFVFQYGNLLSYLTVYENIAFSLALNNFDRKAISNRVHELLEKVGLSKTGPALPRELSGGEVQRVSVARAMAHTPQMVLADEPTASLDTDTGRDLVQLMFTMSREHGCTMFIATHDQEIINLADTFLRLRDGKIEREEA
jgi:ABC-type lipoprotein export system ATPase subunit